MARRRVDQTLARRGGWAEALWLPALAFGAVARSRRWLYDHRCLPVQAVPVPVISVGNLSVGGTGKTPLVGFLVEHLQARGVRIGVVARGYGREPGAELNEEGRMLAERFPGLPQAQDPDRVQAALRLVNEGVQGIVLDDGFQHRRLHRDRDIVLIDATRPYGLPPASEGEAPVRAPLPRGFLREGLGALRRADWIIVTRCADPEAPAIQTLLSTLRRAAPQARWALTDHAPDRLWQDPTQPEDPHAWRGREVDLVSGIGNPEAFTRSVEALGVRVHSHRALGDHHEYGAEDFAGLGARPIWTTAKDAPKWHALAETVDLGLDRPWVLEVSLRWHAGREELETDLDSLCFPDGKGFRDALHAGLHG